VQIVSSLSSIVRDLILIELDTQDLLIDMIFTLRIYGVFQNIQTIKAEAKK
jgi:hypothetical protein